MKNYLYGLASLLLLGCGKTQTNTAETYRLHGQVLDMPTGTIKLAKLDLATNEGVTLDSTELKEGKFEFSGDLTQYGLYSLKLNDTIGIPFYLEKDVEITFKAADAKAATVKGSIDNDLFKKYDFAFEKKDYPLLKANANSAFATVNAYYLVQFVEMSDDSLNALVDALHGNATKNEYYTRLKQLATSIKNTKIGSVAPNFTAKGVDGQPISLTDFKGKYLILEFWTSWCGPCRANNPKWQKLYEKYKGNQFDMLSISFDHADKCDAWKEAIIKDGSTWHHASNCNGWNDISDLYAVKAVPQTYLLDPQGKIVAKTFEPEQFEEIFKRVRE